MVFGDFMSEQGFSLLYRFRYFFGGLLVIACLPLFVLFISFIGSGSVQARSNDYSGSQTVSGDDPNLVADSFTAAWSSVSQTATSVNVAVENFNYHLKGATLAVVGTVSHDGKTLASGASQGALFVARAPVSAWHGAASLTHIDSLISPAKASKNQLPQIDPVIAAEIANSKPLLSAGLVAKSTNDTPRWPIHGIITEEFGVPHWPYQPIHTGIDISDGAPLGVTPVRPFEPGRVVAVIHSNEGFGNHVIVNHGGGLLSLYGHMDSTAVLVGQIVDETTVLGYEGSTGLSTGLHVHFEIDLNGQPVNPHLYVAGQP